MESEVRKAIDRFLNGDTSRSLTIKCTGNEDLEITAMGMAANGQRYYTQVTLSRIEKSDEFLRYGINMAADEWIQKRLINR